MDISSLLPVRPTRSQSSSSLDSNPGPRKLHLLVAATGPRDTSWAQAIVVRLSKHSGIEMRAIIDDAAPRLIQTVIVMQNRSMRSAPGGTHDDSETGDIEFYRQQAFDLVGWADLMILAPMDADGMAEMMRGRADTFLLEVLRGWNAAKTIMLVPGMSKPMWENPLTRRQLSKIDRKWTWVRVMSPILWHYEGGPRNPKRVVSWDGFNDAIAVIKNQVDLLHLGHDVDAVAHQPHVAFGDTQVYSKLPLEIWTIILDFVQDWELAQALRIYTNTPMPPQWCQHAMLHRDPVQIYRHELDLVVLSCDNTAICKKLSYAPRMFHDLSAITVKLIIRFSLLKVLAYLEVNRPDLFRAFDSKILVTTAAAYYNRVDVLDYWKQSLYFRGRHVDLYDHEALDGASMNGYIRVLDWWRNSGLPLRFTKSAIEQAAMKGHIHVLEWWRETAAMDDRILLRPGKALLRAARHGQLDVIRWWISSGMPIVYNEMVPRIASRWGQVDFLELWRQLNGDDQVIFDDEVLIQPTRHRHVDVLEWWRRFAHGELDGMEARRRLLEYRTCDIDEALEGGEGDRTAVRKWWVDNGLDLELRSVEWMKTKFL